MGRKKDEQMLPLDPRLVTQQHIDQVRGALAEGTLRVGFAKDVTFEFDALSAAPPAATNLSAETVWARCVAVGRYQLPAVKHEPTETPAVAGFEGGLADLFDALTPVDSAQNTYIHEGASNPDEIPGGFHDFPLAGCWAISPSIVARILAAEASLVAWHTVGTSNSRIQQMELGRFYHYLTSNKFTVATFKEGIRYQMQKLFLAPEYVPDSN